MVLSCFTWSCSLIPPGREFVSDRSDPVCIERREHLEKMTILSGSGQIGFDSLEGNVTLFFNFEYRTRDTLNIWIQDPLGRQLAELELCGDTYHLRLVREGKYFTGTQIETDLTPFPIGTLSPAVILRILQGAPFENESGANSSQKDQIDARYRFYPGRDEPAELDWRPNGRRLRINYKSYANIEGIQLPEEIMINEKTTSLSVVIHFSHFSAGMLKFRS